jgi:hypothetical protein
MGIKFSARCWKEYPDNPGGRKAATAMCHSLLSPTSTFSQKRKPFSSYPTDPSGQGEEDRLWEEESPREEGLSGS